MQKPNRTMLTNFRGDYQYTKANQKMHADMSIDYTGDPDKDFIRGMIPHHQGAIDMAKVVLKYGKDPKVKELAKI